MLGKKVKDKITGFEGIATQKYQHLYGCDQIGVTPERDKEGKLRDIGWFDIGRIEIIGDGINPESVQSDRPGSEFAPHP